MFFTFFPTKLSFHLLSWSFFHSCINSNQRQVHKRTRVLAWLPLFFLSLQLKLDPLCSVLFVLFFPLLLFLILQFPFSRSRCTSITIVRWLSRKRCYDDLTMAWMSVFFFLFLFVSPPWFSISVLCVRLSPSQFPSLVFLSWQQNPDYPQRHKKKNDRSTWYFSHLFFFFSASLHFLPCGDAVGVSSDEY